MYSLLTNFIADIEQQLEVEYTSVSSTTFAIEGKNVALIRVVLMRPWPRALTLIYQRK